MIETKKYVETPLMKQYYDIKAIHSDAILLFRVGDFYETFGDDAIKASGILGITLTRRANGSATFVELAGFPYHSLETYLPKLVRAGQRVAICEQLEDPKTTKKIVKRGVIELVTPGVALNDNVLNHKDNTFLAAVYFGKRIMGVSFLDLSTGEFYVAQGTAEYIDKLLSNFGPKEVIYQRGCQDEFATAFGTKYYTYKVEEWMFSVERSRDKLKTQLGVSSLKGFGVESMEEGVTAAGAILYYLDFTEHKQTKHINSIARLDKDRYVWIDRFTLRNLELLGSTSEDGRSLCSVIDRTLTPMGARMLKRWISLPLGDMKEITERQAVVESLIADAELSVTLSEHIGLIGDVERIISKIATLRVAPRELISLKGALESIEQVKENTANSTNKQIKQISDGLDSCIATAQRIDREIYSDPSNQIQKGGVIADGVDAELDELRKIANHGKAVLIDIQERESEATGIPSLKVNFNNVFGYYIEVRNAHKDKVPERWIRKQTLVNAERYITQELKEYEEKILGAEDRIMAIESRLYEALLNELLSQMTQMQQSATLIAKLDCLLSFATISKERGYAKPTMSESKVLNIKSGRHPVIEASLPLGSIYVPNDVYLDDTTQQIIIITGPNMSGKSALLRQTALIVLMAQMGCYVPAASAEIGIVDKIFTRVGASDNISQGESTFMVEMLESASILNNISDRSLVLLDEIGRGTSTYDGISIAWAMVEFIHDKCRAKTLFATHYHELNEIENQFDRVKNFNVSVREVDRKVVFLRKLVPGGTEHSFGIHVAKMAGMPNAIVNRATQILHELEQTRQKGDPCSVKVPAVKDGMQLSFFQLDDPVLGSIRDEIRGLDINSLTPLEALNKLSEIKKITGI